MRFLRFIFCFSSKKGFTLIDVLIGIGLLLIVFLGIFGAYQLSVLVIGQSKAKIIATYLANSEIEKIRNLPYESIGVQGSFPDGIIEAQSEITQNNINFIIERRVDYVVDSVDGLFLPEDECPNDYKKVQIKVSSLGKFSAEFLAVIDITPANLAQECAQEGGILSVIVFDAYGVLVNSPLIEIRDPFNDSILKTATPFDGKHYFSLIPGTYKIVVSKDGYSSDQTFKENDVYQGKTIVSPEKPNAIVLNGRLTEVSFSIDKLSSMQIETTGVQELEYPPIPGVSFNLRGEKIVGRSIDDEPIYKYSQNKITNNNGTTSISGLEWDNYYFSINSSGLELVDIELPPAGSTTTQPISLSPDNNLSLRLILKAENSLLVAVKDYDTDQPIFSANVRLYSSPLNYDLTQYTGQDGKTYFIPLENGNYNLEVEGPGYASSTSSVLVSGETATVIKLQQIE